MTGEEALHAAFVDLERDVTRILGPGPPDGAAHIAVLAARRRPRVLFGVALLGLLALGAGIRVGVGRNRSPASGRGWGRHARCGHSAT
ncbi:hypothetical protein [Streptomyces sp. SID3343]|uniref:hypothetical protein n=1 Tax=Streptomyces sp. SID3343 TaxID=2690260 RepID=UPI00136E1A5A|nr:hypothetical protein [Streptomyces sp. SID3343]MYW00447.1 hypothetical protein [Streptomyces sp. SID3343]